MGSRDGTLRVDVEVGPVPAFVYHVLPETPCPYLSNRWERKLLTELRGPEAQEHYDLLSRSGFRRSHNYAYRPACTGCNACVPVRIDSQGFRYSKSQRRVWRMNSSIAGQERAPVATEEQYAVFQRYIASRHGDGEMASMTMLEYRGMVEQSCLDTKVIEFITDENELAGVALIDWLVDGPSAVYSFFAPEFARRSMGTYIVLWLVEAARAHGLSYVYLGYWIREARKMSYKSRFRPLQCLGPDGWRPLEDD